MQKSFLALFTALVTPLIIVGCDSGNSGNNNHTAPGPVVCKKSNFPAALQSQISDLLTNDFSLVPGAVVAIYHPDHGYAISAFGVADTGNSTPMSTDAVFDVGSVHKVFKWVLLEKLVDKDLLDFNDNINTYISNPIINNGKIFHLPYHATGMVDIDSSIYDDIWARTNSGTTTFKYTYNEVITFLAEEDDVDNGITDGFINGFVLGENYNYSSYGPVLAGEIARQITGKSPRTLLNKYIIDELHLANTSFHGYDEIPEKLVLGYGNDYEDPLSVPTGVHPQPNQNLMLPTTSAVTGAIFSNACDLTHLSRSISDPSLHYLSSEIIESRIAITRDVGAYLRIARGLMKYDSQYSGNFWVHAGDGAHGHSSLTGYNPDKNMSVTILTNFNPAYMKHNYADEYAAHFAIIQLLDDYY